MTEILRTGGCACGEIRWTARAEPRRVGLCHCMTCRKAHGAVFNPFVVYAKDRVELAGSPKAWVSSPGYTRWFCGTCGARVFGELADEYELTLGGFDEVGTLAVGYESWCEHREPWLPDLGVPRYPHNRP